VANAGIINEANTKIAIPLYKLVLSVLRNRRLPKGFSPPTDLLSFQLHTLHFEIQTRGSDDTQSAKKAGLRMVISKNSKVFQNSIIAADLFEQPRGGRSIVRGLAPVKIHYIDIELCYK
jgi:hypothetical protein